MNTDACSVRHRQAEMAVSRRGHYKNYTYRDFDSRNTKLKSKVKVSTVWLVCTAFSEAPRNILSPCYLRSGTLKVVQCSLKCSTATFLLKASNGPPPTLFWNTNLARTKAVLDRALKSLTKLLTSQFGYMYMPMLKLPINFKHVHFVLW